MTTISRQLYKKALKSTKPQEIRDSWAQVADRIEGQHSPEHRMSKILIKRIQYWDHPRRIFLIKSANL